MLKTSDEDKNFKSSPRVEKTHFRQRAKTGLTATIASETMQVRREERNVFKVWRGKKQQVFQKQR